MMENMFWKNIGIIIHKHNFVRDKPTVPLTGPSPLQDRLELLTHRPGWDTFPLYARSTSALDSVTSAGAIVAQS
jgi:hypothetical protein